MSYSNDALRAMALRIEAVWDAPLGATHKDQRLQELDSELQAAWHKRDRARFDRAIVAYERYAISRWGREAAGPDPQTRREAIEPLAMTWQTFRDMVYPAIVARWPFANRWTRVQFEAMAEDIGPISPESAVLVVKKMARDGAKAPPSGGQIRAYAIKLLREQRSSVNTGGTLL